MDNSGNWGTGGFFAAISALSKEPQLEYERAGEMDDLELGSLHLIEVGTRKPDDEEDVPGAEYPKLYVANAIVQNRTKSSQKISGT